MTEMRLYLLQRLSAAIMAPLVFLHLGVMIYAIQGGLDAAEILARTRGSLFWGASYGIFVLAASLHAAIGVRNILKEWLAPPAPLLSLVAWVFGLSLLGLGMRAVSILVAGA